MCGQKKNIAGVHVVCAECLNFEQSRIFSDVGQFATLCPLLEIKFIVTASWLTLTVLGRNVLTTIALIFNLFCITVQVNDLIPAKLMIFPLISALHCV